MVDKVLVAVRWSMALEPDKPDWTTHMFTACTTLLPAWAGLACNAEVTAAAIAEEVLEDAEVWEDWFGPDTSQMLVWLHLLAPETCAGWYEVHVQRTVTARATRVPQAAEAP